jgi:hypothetical protein
MRSMREGTFDDDSDLELSESESTTVMACGDDDDEEERASQRSSSYAPTEVFSKSEQQSWVLMYQPQQGVALQR